MGVVRLSLVASHISRLCSLTLGMAQGCCVQRDVPHGPVRVGWGGSPASCNSQSHITVWGRRIRPLSIRNPPALQENSHGKLLNFQLVWQ